MLQIITKINVCVRDLSIYYQAYGVTINGAVVDKSNQYGVGDCFDYQLGIDITVIITGENCRDYYFFGSCIGWAQGSWNFLSICIPLKTK